MSVEGDGGGAGRNEKPTPSGPILMRCQVLFPAALGVVHEFFAPTGSPQFGSGQDLSQMFNRRPLYNLTHTPSLPLLRVTSVKASAHEGKASAEPKLSRTSHNPHPQSSRNWHRAFTAHCLQVLEGVHKADPHIPLAEECEHSADCDGGGA